MRKLFTRMSAGSKKSVLVLVIILFGVTTLIATLTAKAIGGTASGDAETAAYSDASQSNPRAAQSMDKKLDMLLVEQDEAWKANDWGRCIQALEAIVALDTGNSAMRERILQAHLNHGWQLLVIQRLDEARAEFSLALQIKPDNAEAQDGLRLLQQLVPASNNVLQEEATPAMACTPTPECTPEEVVVETPCPVCTPTPVATECPVNVVQVPVCPPAQLVVPAGFISHTVRTDDTLFNLAQRFNTTVEAIIAANGLTTCTIFICQTLLIPVGTTQPVCPTTCPPVCVPVCPTECPPTCVPVCPTECPPTVVQVCPTPCPPVSISTCPSSLVIVRTHVVRRGETLFSLAARFKVSVSTIMQVNGLTSTSIHVGQVLIIP